ncbi:MAG: hypothetical protein QUS33_05355 [Dehalococcoidia bacterium]|nr:hypothetical protein [Dehalococcoidia bacterium]
MSKLRFRWYHNNGTHLLNLIQAPEGVTTVALEDRFRSFANQQKAPRDQHYEPYDRDVESMKKVDSTVSKVLEAFCHAVGWSLKRSDHCDRDRGAVLCNYLLEHQDFSREGYVTVDVEVTRGYRSDPVEAVTLYTGKIVGTAEHARDVASKLVIPFGELTEERLAAALEQQSSKLITHIIRLQKPRQPVSYECGRLQETLSLEDRFRGFLEAQNKAEWDRQHQEAYERNLASLKKTEPMVSEFLHGYSSALGWNVERHDYCSPAAGVVSCCYQLSPSGLDAGHVDVWVSVTDRQEPEPGLIEYVEIDGGARERTRIAFAELSKERLAAALAVQSAGIITRISQREGPQ